MYTIPKFPLEVAKYLTYTIPRLVNVIAQAGSESDGILNRTIFCIPTLLVVSQEQTHLSLDAITGYEYPELEG